MKKILLFVVFIGLGLSTQAQKLAISDIPGTVKDAFKSDYPSVEDEAWTKVGNNFNAGFEENDLGKSVTYAATGTLVRTDEEIVVSDFPYSATAYMDKNHPGSEINSAYKVTLADGTVTYRAEIDGTELFFNSDGNFLKTPIE